MSNSTPLPQARKDVPVTTIQSGTAVHVGARNGIVTALLSTLFVVKWDGGLGETMYPYDDIGQTVFIGDVNKGDV